MELLLTPQRPVLQCIVRCSPSATKPRIHGTAPHPIPNKQTNTHKTHSHKEGLSSPCLAVLEALALKANVSCFSACSLSEVYSPVCKCRKKDAVESQGHSSNNHAESWGRTSAIPSARDPRPPNFCSDAVFRRTSLFFNRRHALNMLSICSCVIQALCT